MIELFKAADKYDVLGLVQECVASFRQLTGAHEVAPLLQVCIAGVNSPAHSQVFKHISSFGVPYIFCQRFGGGGQVIDVSRWNLSTHSHDCSIAGPLSEALP